MIYDFQLEDRVKNLGTVLNWNFDLFPFILKNY
jgi:hypothetical protein